MKTPFKDRKGKRIYKGDMVSLDGNITADNSLGPLPNGWHFDEQDIYKVIWDDSISNWSLDLGVKPDTAYNIKYMNHAVGLLHDGEVTIIN